MNSSTSISKKWLAAYLITFLASLGMGWFYAQGLEPETQFWSQAFRDRREVLESRNEKPHVLFTGDSACSFGIDPTVFTNETGVPSVNLGGTRQMGVDIFMREALAQARAGDVVVMIANPTLLAFEDGELSKTGAQMALALGDELSVEDRYKASRPGFSHLVSLAGKFALRKPMFRYRLSDLKENGQVVTADRDHPAGQSQAFEMTRDDVLRCAELLNDWNQRCKAQGVRFCYLISLELTSSEMLEENRAAKTALFEELVTLAGDDGVRILEPPFAACSDEDALFADTLFHLTADGAENFTKEVAQAVMSQLESP